MYIQCEENSYFKIIILKNRAVAIIYSFIWSSQLALHPKLHITVINYDVELYLPWKLKQAIKNVCQVFLNFVFYTH